MTGAFIIEVSGETAGLALPDPGGYRFVASTPSYGALDGASFRTVAKAQRAAEELARAHRRHLVARRSDRHEQPRRRELHARHGRTASLAWGLLIDGDTGFARAAPPGARRAGSKTSR